MRQILAGVAFALAFSGVAYASDYIVVHASDASVKVGQAFDAGARVPVAAGKTLTVIRASGAVTTLTAGRNGVVLPAAESANDTARMDAVRALFAPPPSGRAFGARRGGFCAPADTLKTFDAILEANQGACKAQARQAFQTYLAAKGAPGTDAIYLVSSAAP